MKMRTTLALGAVLAGTLLTGVGTTSAAFSDSDGFAAVIGAGQVTVSVDPTALTLTPRSGTGTITVTNTGTTGVSLAVAAIDAQHRPSSDCPKITVAAGPQVNGRPQGSQPCGPDGRGVELLELPEGATTTLTVRATAFGQRWTGGLRVTVDQDGGGFSDSADVSVQVQTG